MHDKNYYKEKLTEIMKYGFMSKAELARSIGIGFMTLQKVWLEDDTLSPLTMRKIKRYVDVKQIEDQFEKR